MSESVETRLARVEEGIVGLHGKVGGLTTEIREHFKPLKTKVDQHSLSIAVLKRDRWWLFGLAGFAISTAVYVKLGVHV